MYTLKPKKKVRYTSMIVSTLTRQRQSGIRSKATLAAPEIQVKVGRWGVEARTVPTCGTWKFPG